MTFIDPHWVCVRGPVQHQEEACDPAMRSFYAYYAIHTHQNSSHVKQYYMVWSYADIANMFNNCIIVKSRHSPINPLGTNNLVCQSNFAYGTGITLAQKLIGYTGQKFNIYETLNLGQFVLKFARLRLTWMCISKLDFQRVWRVLVDGRLNGHFVFIIIAVGSGWHVSESVAFFEKSLSVSIRRLSFESQS